MTLQWVFRNKCYRGTEVDDDMPLQDTTAEEEEEGGGGAGMLPVLGGVTVAAVMGAPVYFVSNIKLAMFSAIGGGIMGYTTGKMFSDWGSVSDVTII